MPINVFNVKNVEVLNLLAALVSISRFEIVGINEITGKGAAERFHSLKIEASAHLSFIFVVYTVVATRCCLRDCLFCLDYKNKQGSRFNSSNLKSKAISMMQSV